MTTTNNAHDSSLYARLVEAYDALLMGKPDEARHKLINILYQIKADEEEARNGINDKNPAAVKHVLSRLAAQDPEARVTVPVQAYTQAYPAGYFAPWRIEHAHDDSVRIWINLPEGYIIGKRGKK